MRPAVLKIAGVLVVLVGVAAGVAVVVAHDPAPDGPPAVAVIAAAPRLLTPAPHAITLRGQEPGAMFGEPDGSLRVALYGTELDEDGEVQDTDVDSIRTVTPDGRLGASFALPASTDAEQIGALTIGLTATGSVTTSTSYPRRGNRSVGNGEVHVTSRDLAGKVVADDTLALRGQAYTGGVITATGGAVVVHGNEAPAHSGDPQPTWLALRPAGAAHVGPIVRPDAGSRERPTVDIAVGPDGGGALLGTPSDGTGVPTVRRITPAGQLGAPIPLRLPAGLSATGSLAFGPTGILVVALSTSPVNPHAGPGGGLFLATIPAGATSATPPRRIPGGAASTAGDGASIAIGKGDHVIVAARHRPSGFTVFEGRGSALHPVALARNGDSVSPDLLLAPDGALTLVWDQGSGAGPGRSRVLAVRRPAGRAFGPAVQLSAPDLRTTQGGPAALNADGSLAVAYDGPDGDRAYLLPRVVLPG